MKLLFCLKCQDIRKLGNDWTRCKCGESAARYLGDDWHAEYVGKNVVPVGFANDSFASAVRLWQGHQANYRFVAFTMPDDVESIEMKEGPIPEEAKHG